MPTEGENLMRLILGRNRLQTALAIALLTALTGGCIGSSSAATVKSGSLAQDVSLKGATFTVGSKEFTEQLITCHITILALRSVGATVREKCGLQGTEIVRAALIAGSIDMYWEYTGTAWINILDHRERINDPTQQYNAVALEDLTQNDVKWLAPAPANNAYAIGMKCGNGLGVRTISDYAELVRTNPSAASMCVASEFAIRNDGLPGLGKAYGFAIPDGHLATLAEDDIYAAISKGDRCNFGEVSTTDGRLPAFGLTTLTDDKEFFPIYTPALTVRETVYNDHQDLAKIAKPIADALTNEELQRLNGEVDVKGKKPNQVAKDWLQAKGFIGT
jgi:osmoprotectant transport system substrate-binding protein